MYSLVGVLLPIRTRGYPRTSRRWRAGGDGGACTGYSRVLPRYGSGTGVRGCCGTAAAADTHTYIYTCHPDGGADLCWRAGGRVGAWHETVLKPVLKHGYATRVLTA